MPAQLFTYDSLSIAGAGSDDESYTHTALAPGIIAMRAYELQVLRPNTAHSIA